MVLSSQAPKDKEAGLWLILPGRIQMPVLKRPESLTETDSTWTEQGLLLQPGHLRGIRSTGQGDAYGQGGRNLFRVLHPMVEHKTQQLQVLTQLSSML